MISVTDDRLIFIAVLLQCLFQSISPMMIQPAGIVKPRQKPEDKGTMDGAACAIAGYDSGESTLKMVMPLGAEYGGNQPAGK
jgi:hypothetical protein